MINLRHMKFLGTIIFSLLLSSQSFADKKFEKDLKKLSAEVAFFDNQLYTKDDIAKVATLTSLEEIRGKIVGLINAPASKIVRLLQRPDQDIISILQNKKD